MYDEPCDTELVMLVNGSWIKRGLLPYCTKTEGNTYACRNDKCKTKKQCGFYYTESGIKELKWKRGLKGTMKVMGNV